MKKLTIIILLCAGIFVSSCDKYLDIQPANVKSISSIEDIRGILAGYLLTIKSTGGALNTEATGYTYEWYSGLKFPMGSDLFQMFSYYDNSQDHTEDLLGYQEQRYGATIAKALNWASIEVHGTFWMNAYKNIGFSNRILAEVDKLDDPDPQIKEQIVGEVKIIRAWNAMKLLQYFAPFTNDELGIPLKFDTEDLTSTIEPRKTQTQVYEMILSDLEEVLAYTTPTKEDYNIFYRKNIINGILAQLYLYKATGPAKAEDDWEKARTYALAAMENKYLVSGVEDLKTLFFTTEARTQFNSPYAAIVFFYSYKGPQPWTSTIWGNPYYRDLGYNAFFYTGRPFHPELLALYDEDDIRMEEGMFIYNDLYKENNKWLTRGDGGITSGVYNSYQFIRTAELHLIVAETYAREGNDATAKQWLDEFKASRNTSFYASTDILAEILNERRKEFCSEFDIRWLDLKRNEMSLTHEFIDPVNGPQTINLQSNDYRFAFYIPVEGELSMNTGLEQNPGWSN